jgi:hypothetical protein
MEFVVRCAGCGVSVGRLLPFFYGGERGDDHEDYAFVSNSNFGGKCRSCGDVFCGHCSDLDVWGSCRVCSGDRGWDDGGSFDYDPFYRAVRAYVNNKISRSRFTLEWEMAQKDASLEVQVHR